jgi:hypothetical protein
MRSPICLRSIGKFPLMTPFYESRNVPGLFFVGAIMHGRDGRRAAGGFIHGFRTAERLVHNFFEWRLFGVPWPSVKLNRFGLVDFIIKRADESSCLYQMFRTICDVAVLSEDRRSVTYFQELPCTSIDTMHSVLGISGNEVITIHMDYGEGYSYPGADTLRLDRAEGDYRYAHESNFLHPIIRYYDWRHCSEENATVCRVGGQGFKEHHMLEEFLTDFTLPISHVYALRMFLEHVTQVPFTLWSPEKCLAEFTRTGSWSSRCTDMHRPLGPSRIRM